ncbi:MAG: LacI family DNA-binding transcriptional regulator [Azospirillaceae bacterium]|nr:LacI family DNA-binding transcriptional regulator [Azospirillaceae bacterium]
MTTKSILSEPDISKDAVAGRATLQDVARLAGVSPATVSRVLNDPDKVANDTTARVRNAIVATRFVPNAMAVGLANRRTRETQGQQAAPTLSASGLPPRGLAALEAAAAPSAPVVPHSARRAGLVAVLTRQGPADETVAGLVEELAQHNVTALLAHACADEASLRRAAEAAFAHHPAALVLAGLRGDPHLRRRLAKAGVVVVETGDLADDPIDMAVGFSHFAAGHAVARLLAGRGYRRPFLIVEKERGPQAWLEGARAGFASLSAMVPGHLPHRVVPAAAIPMPWAGRPWPTCWIRPRPPPTW